MAEPSSFPHNSSSEAVSSEEVQRSLLLELDAIFTHASLGIIYTQNRLIQRCNPRGNEILGFAPDELIGQPAINIYPGESEYEQLGQLAGPRLAAGESFSAELQLRRSDGSLVWCQVFGKAIDPESTHKGTIWIFDDIETTRRTRRELEAVMKNAAVGIVFTRNRVIQRYNQKFADLLKLGNVSWINQPTRIFFESDAAFADLSEAAFPLLSTGMPFQSEMNMRQQNGSLFAAEVIGYLIDPQNPPEGTIWIVNDITERRAFQDTLRKSHAELELRIAERTQDLAAANLRLNDFADSASDWLWEMGPDLRFSYFSDRIHKALGVDTNIFLGKTRQEIMHAQDIDEKWEKHFADLDNRLPFRDFVYRIKHPSGGTKEISISGKPIFDAEGNFLGYRGIGRDISEILQAEVALRESNEQLRSIIDNAPAVVYLKDISGRYLRTNRRFDEMFDLTPEQIIGKNDFDLFAPEIAEAFVRNDQHVLTSGAAIEAEEAVPVAGRLRTYLSVKFPLRRLTGEVFAIGGISTDITERIEAEQNLRVAATTFESQEGMIITDADETILRVNKAFTEITGYSAEEVVGQTPRLLKSGRHDQKFYYAMWQSILTKGNWNGEIWNRRKNGELYPQLQSVTAVRNDDGVITNYVGTFTDITQRKQAEEEIRDLAFYDSLTRLPNRRLLLDRLRHMLAGLQRSRNIGVLMFIDLDNFKALNDTRGHDVGDELLLQVATRLIAAVRQHDTVARLGGDEFVIMLEDIEDDDHAAAHAEAIAAKVLTAIYQPYQLRDKASHTFEHRCSASIGITLFNDPGQTVDDILKQADLSMYQAKSAGRNTLRFFDPVIQAEAMARAALEADMRRGIGAGQFLLHYQPQIDSRGAIIGVEGLMRWSHPHKGTISPADFIPLAEETGLILALGFQALEAACRQLVAWAERADRRHLNIAVNVSPLQLQHDDFVDHIIALLEHTGANPQRLKLEITETLLMSDPTLATVKMQALRTHGIGFALDDFGTGYSSLSYLKKLPLDQIKIDRSFIRGLPDDQSDGVICRTIVALGDSLGFDLIAEGVEKQTQLDFLREIGCGKIQGYLISKPLHPDHLENFISSWSQTGT